MPALTYPEAIVVGLFQGVSELFPVSSLGHSVLIPALIGGSWARDLNVSAPESPYLAFIVGLHVATALALLAYFWRDWMRIAGGFATSLRDRQISTADQRLAWLIILATIPVGITGLLLEHTFPDRPGQAGPGRRLPHRQRRHLVRRGTAAPPRPGPDHPGRPRPADGRRGRRPAGPGPAPRVGTPSARMSRRPTVTPTGGWPASATRRPCSSAPRRSSPCSPASAASGVTMVAGLTRGLSHEDAARFAFLLATPRHPRRRRPEDPPTWPARSATASAARSWPEACFSGIGAYLSVRFLLRYFQTRTLTPFAIYCTVAGLGSLAYLTLT